VQHTLFRSGPEAKNPADEIQPLNWHLTAGERKEIADRASDSGTDAAIAGRKGLGPGYAPREPANGLRQPAAVTRSSVPHRLRPGKALR